MGERNLTSTASVLDPSLTGWSAGSPARLQAGSGPVPPGSGQPPVDPAEATAFLRLYYTEHGGEADFARRLAEVRAEIDRTGTYAHTGDELVFGARVAWREAHPAVGRQYWFGVEVRDLRHLNTATEVLPELINHLELTATRGRHPIRPIISVFGPAGAGHPSVRVWNERLVAFAGYRPLSRLAAFARKSATGPARPSRPNAFAADPAAGVIGDPATLEFTTTLSAYGWAGAGGPSDVLPLVLHSAGDGIQLVDVPAELAERVLATPTATMANRRLTIGGVSYPLAPFNAVLEDCRVAEDGAPGGRIPEAGRPRFVLDQWATVLARYGQAPVVPSTITLPGVPASAAFPGVPGRAGRRG